VQLVRVIVCEDRLVSPGFGTVLSLHAGVIWDSLPNTVLPLPEPEVLRFATNSDTPHPVAGNVCVVKAIPAAGAGPLPRSLQGKLVTVEEVSDQGTARVSAGSVVLQLPLAALQVIADGRGGASFQLRLASYRVVWEIVANFFQPSRPLDAHLAAILGGPLSNAWGSTETSAHKAALLLYDAVAHCRAAEAALLDPSHAFHIVAAAGLRSALLPAEASAAPSVLLARVGWLSFWSLAMAVQSVVPEALAAVHPEMLASAVYAVSAQPKDAPVARVNALLLGMCGAQPGLLTWLGHNLHLPRVNAMLLRTLVSMEAQSFSAALTHGRSASRIAAPLVPAQLYLGSRLDGSLLLMLPGSMSLQSLASMLFPVPAARSVIAHRVEWQGSAVAVDGLSLRQGETVVVTPPHGGAAFQARIQAVLCSSVWLLTAEDRCLHLDFSDIEAGVFQLSAWTKQWQGTSPLSAPQELPLQQLATQPSRTLRLEARHHSATGLPTIELVGEEGLLPERRPGLPLEAELPFVDALVQRGALAAGFREASLVLEQQEQAHGSGAASLRPTVRRLCQMAALSLAEWRGLVQRLASLVVSTPLAEAILRHRWLRELYWATLGVDASAIVPPLGPLGLGSVIDGVVHSRTATVAAAEVLALAEVVAGARRLRAMVAPSGGPDAAAAPGDSAHLWQLLDAVFLEPGLLLLNGEPMQSGSRHGDGVAVAVSARPLEERQRRDYYFEVKLEADLPARFPAAAVFRTELAVGFAHSHDLVGLKAHADAIYFDVAHSTLHSGSNVLHLPTLLDGVQAGDVIGCGLKDDMAYFTCNGVVLGAFHSLDTRRPMHVALSANAVVRVRVVLREEADRAGGFCFEAEEREVVSVDYLLDSGVHCVPAGLEQAAGEAAPCELPLRQSVQAEAIRSLALMLASLCEACETRWLEAKLPASARDDLTTALAALLANESVTDVEKNAVLYSSVARLLRRLVLESRVVDVSRILSPWRRVAAMVQSYLALLRQLTSTPSSSSSSSSSSSADIAAP
jgi:hypothetical protein